MLAAGLVPFCRSLWAAVGSSEHSRSSLSPRDSCFGSVLAQAPSIRAACAEVGRCHPFLRVTGIVFSPLLQKIQQLSEGSMFGHGLKHLFHSRRRSREREHQNSQDSLPPHYGMSDHDSPDEKERSPEMHRVSYAMSLHDLPARPTAFNRVLQQIRSRPSIKRGTSLHSGSRRAKSSSLEPQKGSPHLVRKAPQDSSLTAILHQHQGRPRSSSTTDTAILLAESGAVYLLTEDTECLADKVDLRRGAISGWLGGTRPCRGGWYRTGCGAPQNAVGRRPSLRAALVALGVRDGGWQPLPGSEPGLEAAGVHAALVGT